MEHWEWPQYVILVIYGLSVLSSAYMHGKPRAGNHSGPTTIIGSVIGIFILYKGGFF